MKILEWANDYRDSLYYGVSAVFCAVLLAFNPPEDIFKLFGNMLWLREMVRWFAWQHAAFKDFNMKGILYAQMAITISCAEAVYDFMVDPEKHRPPLLFFLIGLNAAFAVYGIFKFGGPRSFLRIYAKDLWDWPRKQKPPKEKKDRKLVKKLMEKIRAALAPLPSSVGEAA